MRNLILLGYLIIAIFLYTLNFELFHSAADINIGLGIFTTYPLLILMALGLIFCLFFFLVDKNKQMKTDSIIENLKNEIIILKKDLEIASLKMNSPVVETPITATEEII
jgi:type III secretory pathway component EscV